MPAPQKVIVERSGPARARPTKGYFRTAYESVTSSENASMVRAVAVFGASVAFLSSSWAELLLPPA